jgi:acetyl-CoA carboxylase biotin carboxyl carrier protein
MAEPKGSKGSGDSGAMRIDADLVRELAELLTANALTEIEVAEGDRRIRVCRDPAPVIGVPASPAPAAAAPAASAAQPVDGGEAEEISGFTVKSPMVGTAFMSSEPGAAPFVETGDAVKAGDTLLIVEAMKVMNPITAPSGGVVKKIFVSDAQPVEFDQPLVIIG